MTDRDIVKQDETRMMESPRKTARVCMLAMLASVVGLAPMRAVAEESETALAKQTQNPVADLISVPFQNNVNFGTLSAQPSASSWTPTLNVEQIRRRHTYRGKI